MKTLLVKDDLRITKAAYSTKDDLSRPALQSVHIGNGYLEATNGKAAVRQYLADGAQQVSDGDEASGILINAKELAQVGKSLKADGKTKGSHRLVVATENENHHTARIYDSVGILGTDVTEFDYDPNTESRLNVPGTPPAQFPKLDDFFKDPEDSRSVYIDAKLLIQILQSGHGPDRFDNKEPVEITIGKCETVNGTMDVLYIKTAFVEDGYPQFRAIVMPMADSEAG